MSLDMNKKHNGFALYLAGLADIFEQQKPKCLLCDNDADGYMAFKPKNQKQAGAPKGFTRVANAPLCFGCLERPGTMAAVKKAFSDWLKSSNQ